MDVRKPKTSIDHAAWVLIRKFGDSSAIEAYRRGRCCACRGDTLGEAEWRRVLRKVIELNFAPPSGPAH